MELPPISESNRRQNFVIQPLFWCFIVGTAFFWHAQIVEAVPKEILIGEASSFLHSSLGEPRSVDRAVAPTPVVPKALKSPTVITSSTPRKKDIPRRSRRSPHPYSQFVNNSPYPSHYSPSSFASFDSQLFFEYNPEAPAENVSSFQFHPRKTRDRRPSSPLPRYRRGPTEPNKMWRNYVLEDFLQYIGSGEGSTEEWHHQSRDTAWLELQSSPRRVAPLPTNAYLQSPYVFSSSTSPSRITIVSTVYKTSTEYATTLYTTRTPLVTATVQSMSKPSTTWQELYTSCSHQVAALESDQKREPVQTSSIATGNKVKYQTSTMFVTSTVTSVLIETKTVTDPLSELSTTSSLGFEPTAPMVIAPSPTVTHRLPKASTMVLIPTPPNDIHAGTTEANSSSTSSTSEETSTSPAPQKPSSSIPLLTPSSLAPTTELHVNITESLSTASPPHDRQKGTTQYFSVDTESTATEITSVSENITEHSDTMNFTHSFDIKTGNTSDTENKTSIPETLQPSDHQAVSETSLPINFTDLFVQEISTITTERSDSTDTTDYTTEYLFDRTIVPVATTEFFLPLSSQTPFSKDMDPTFGPDTVSVYDVSSTIPSSNENSSEPVSLESDSITTEKISVDFYGSGFGDTTTFSTLVPETNRSTTLSTEAVNGTDFWSITSPFSFADSTDTATTTIKTDESVVTSSLSTSSTYDFTESSVPYSEISNEFRTSSSTSHPTSSTSSDSPTSSSASSSSTTTSTGSTLITTEPWTKLTTRITTPVTTQTTASTQKSIPTEEQTTEASVFTTLSSTVEVATIDITAEDESISEPATTPLSSTTSSPEATTTSTPLYVVETGVKDLAPDPEYWVRTIIEGKLRDVDIEENKIETGLSEVFRSAFGFGRNEDSELLKNFGEPVTLNIPRSDDPESENRIRRDTFLNNVANPPTKVLNSREKKDSSIRTVNYRNYLSISRGTIVQRNSEDPFAFGRHRRQLRATSPQENDENSTASLDQETGSVPKVDASQFETAFLARNIEKINAKIHNISHDARTNKTDLIYVVYDGSTPIPADEAVASLRNIINERMSDAIGYKVHLTEEYLRSKEETSHLTWLESNVWIWYVLGVIVLFLLLLVIFSSTYCLYWKKRPYKSSGISDTEERRSTRTFAGDVEASTSGRTSGPTMDAGEESSTSSSSSQREDEEEASALRPQVRHSRPSRDFGDASGPSGWSSRSPDLGQGGPPQRHLPPPRLPRLAAPMHNLPYADLPPSILRQSHFKNQREASSDEATSVPETDTDDNAFLGRPGSYRRIRKRFHELLADAFNILDGGQKADRVDSLTGQENRAIEEDAPLSRPGPSTSGRSLVSAKLARMRNFTLSGNKRLRKNFIGPTGLAVPRARPHLQRRQSWVVPQQGVPLGSLQTPIRSPDRSLLQTYSSTREYNL